jgi:hypothetical protein
MHAILEHQNRRRGEARIYSVVYLAPASTPTGAQIVAGLDASNAPALHAFSVPYTGAGVYDEPEPGWTGAQPGVAYLQAWVYRSAAGEFSAVVVAEITPAQAVDEASTRRRRMPIRRTQEDDEPGPEVPAPAAAPDPQPVAAPKPAPEPVIAQAVAEIVARAPRAALDDAALREMQLAAIRLQLAEDALLARAEQAMAERLRREIQEDNAAAANAAALLLMA